MPPAAAIPPPGAPRLSPQLPAGMALRWICAEQLGAMQRHLPGARAGRDPEELHDLRVAVRRTRSALGAFRRYFPEPQHDRFCREFRWLGEITGPVRDLDVYLDKLPGYRQLLPPSEAAALAALGAFLQRHRRLEQRRLVRRLASVRLQRLLIDWQRFLDGVDGSVWPERAGQTIGELARRRVWKFYRRFLRQGAAISAASPDRDLHRLRITGKKLRYLVEFFRSLYPPAEIELLVKAMKGIQDFLGDYQDFTVQQAHLTELGRQMAAEGEVPPETRQAMTRLVESLRTRQHRARRDFPKRFRIFSHGRGQRGFMRLYAPPEGEA